MDLLSAMATFVRVVDGESLSRAAKGLRVTPAAVSRQISALEDELGASLLIRTTRHVEATEEGRRFYEHAKRTLAEADEARAAVRTGRAAISGLLTVSVPTAIGLSILDISLAEFVAEHPSLRVDLRLEDHPVDLLADGIDVAVRAGLVPPDTTTLVAQPIADGERVVVAAPSYLRKHGEPKQPADLARHAAIIHLHSGADLGVWTLESGDLKPSIEVQGSLRMNALPAIRNAAIAGAGIALLPRFLVAPDIDEKRLRVLSLGGFHPRSQRIYALVRGESKLRARVRVFLDHLRAALNERVRT